MNARLFALLAVLVLTAPALADGDHADRIEDTSSDRSDAQAVASDTLTTIAIGALFGLGLGAAIGGVTTYLATQEGNRR